MQLRFRAVGVRLATSTVDGRKLFGESEWTDFNNE